MDTVKDLESPQSLHASLQDLKLLEQLFRVFLNREYSNVLFAKSISIFENLLV